MLLKGPEAHLPNGCSFHDKDGHLRHETRLRWWDPAATTFRTAAIGMEGHETELPDEPIPADFVYRDQTPVLFGHYWMQGLPYILDPHASCLAHCLARRANSQSHNRRLLKRFATFPNQQCLIVGIA